MTWEERVSQLEAEGLTRSDAQGAVDVENGKTENHKPFNATAKDSKV